VKKQVVLKEYYGSFGNNYDGTKETASQLGAAEKFTKLILDKLPSGNVNDKDTLCHILNSLLGNQNQNAYSTILLMVLIFTMQA
jgi:hypothetical protein